MTRGRTRARSSTGSEAADPNPPLYPRTPVQRVVAYLIELYGDAIVGAGPTGLALAILLAQRGAQVGLR